MDGFNQLLAAGMQSLQSFTSAAASYFRAARGDEPSLCVSIQVSWGATEFEEFSDRSVMLATEAEDAQINDYEKLLELIGSPQPGDRITQHGRVREVMGMQDEPCFRFDSSGRHFLRIHTRIVKG